MVKKRNLSKKELLLYKILIDFYLAKIELDELTTKFDYIKQPIEVKSEPEK
jgi:hypothetical protein